MAFDLIVGIHSIAAALKNAARSNLKLFLTDEGQSELLKKGGIAKNDLARCQVSLLSKHLLQQKSAEYYKELGLEYQRVPSQVFLLADCLEQQDVNWIYQTLETKKLKLVCLDQVTDVNNAAAILRTASFYGVDCLIIPKQNTFGYSPSFFRIASGAAEYLPVVQASSLAKLITGLNNRNVTTIALSEHEEEKLDSSSLDESSVCLIVGKEDTGISNAVMRQAKFKLALKGKGEIKSLNVATAAAISMEKCFGGF